MYISRLSDGTSGLLVMASDPSSTGPGFGESSITLGVKSNTFLLKENTIQPKGPGFNS